MPGFNTEGNVYLYRIKYETKASLKNNGGKDDETPPTLAQDSNNSFSINETEIFFGNNSTTKIVKTKKPTEFIIKLTDNQGPRNISHLSLYLNIHGTHIKNDLTETAVIFNKFSDLEILDPHNLIENATINVGNEEDEYTTFTFNIIFSDNIETSDVLFRAWISKEIHSISMLKTL